MTQNKKRLTTYAFIDSQNLNMGVGENMTVHGRRIHTGWRLDFQKFRRFLKDKYKVEEAFLFVGNLPGNEGLYEYLQRSGYVVILKPTTEFKDLEGNTKVKGNVDTDLVLYAAAKEADHYDKAVIVTGDGDFLSLIDYLADKDKLGKIIIPNKRRYSQLLNKYAEYFDYVSVNKKKLEKQTNNKA